MNGCGGESIMVEVSGTSAEEGGYEHLVTEAMQRVSAMLDGAAVHRRHSDCGGHGGLGAGEEWYIGCAHSRISGGGTQISGQFTFLRYGSEEAF